MLAALDTAEPTRSPTARSGPTIADEDVHTALERGLLELLGTLGGKLRAGRSRNDQVATDLRLYLRDQSRAVAAGLVELIVALTDQAEAHIDTGSRLHPPAACPAGVLRARVAQARARVRPGPRPARRLGRRAALSPLGAGALAGSALELDPQAVAAELGFTVRSPTPSTPSATATSSPSSSSRRR